VRILVVDDQVLFREGLVGLLKGQSDLKVVGEASTVAEAIEMARELKPDLVLMDFALPDGTGLEATETILAERPETNIVFLTIHEQDDRLFSAIRCGAKGYLLKNVPVSKLLSYLRGIERGEAAISLTMAGHILQEFHRQRPRSDTGRVKIGDLTLREEEVFRELVTGATNQEIAERLVISENTVKVHVSNILAKLNLRNRREAASYARKHNLL
jgi:two-component system NarL family response regulator